jgi:hypothetical protein
MTEAQKMDTTDAWRILLDPNFQPGPRPDHIHNYLRSQRAQRESDGALGKRRPFGGWLFKECKENASHRQKRGSACDLWRHSGGAKGARDLVVNCPGAGAEQLVKRGLVQKLRRRYGTVCHRSSVDTPSGSDERLRFHAYTVLRQDGQGGFVEDKATVLYHVLEVNLAASGPSLGRPGPEMDMTGSMHMFDTGDAAAQLSELMFLGADQQKGIPNPNGFIHGNYVRPVEAKVGHGGIMMSKGGITFSGKGPAKKIEKKTVKKIVKKEPKNGDKAAVKKFAVKRPVKKLVGVVPPTNHQGVGDNETGVAMQAPRTSAQKSEDTTGSRSEESLLPLEKVLAYLTDDNFGPGSRPMLYSAENDGVLFKEKRLARCHRRLQADRWKHSGGAKGARDLPAGGPPQLRRRYGTILPYGYRKAPTDDKPRYRYRQYNRLFTDAATGELKEDVDCVLFHVIIDTIVPSKVAPSKGKPKSSAKAKKTLRRAGQGPTSAVEAVETAKKKPAVFRLSDIKRKRDQVQQQSQQRQAQQSMPPPNFLQAMQNGVDPAIVLQAQQLYARQQAGQPPMTNGMHNQPMMFAPGQAPPQKMPFNGMMPPGMRPAWQHMLDQYKTGQPAVDGTNGMNGYV